MKLRKLLHLAAAALMILGGCKKDDDNAPPSGGGNGGGTDTTGNNGNGLVASWSPVKPYPDDAITLTGGPFNTNAASNSVVSQSLDFDILSVSSTQLVVKAPSTFSANAGGFSTMVIQSGAAADTIYPLYWKRPLIVINMENNLDDWWVGAPARPGDSVIFAGSGFTHTGMSFSINGQSAGGPYYVDSAFWGEVHFRIPVAWGSGSDENETTTAYVTATNADGRTDTLTIGWAPTPDMEINGLELLGGGSLFDQSDMAGNGLVLNFRVHGKYLNAAQEWGLAGPTTLTGTLGVGGFPSEAFIMINPGSLATGGYTLSLPGTFHSYSFTLVP